MGMSRWLLLLTALVSIQCGSPASQPPIGSAEAGASAAEAGASAVEAGAAQSEAGSDSDAGAGSGPVAEQSQSTVRAEKAPASNYLPRVPLGVATQEPVTDQSP
jgi:hypothetical protein